MCGLDGSVYATEEKVSLQYVCMLQMYMISLLTSPSGGDLGLL